MFDGPFDVFALIIAIVAFLIAIKASSQAAELRRRLSSLEEMFYAQRQVQPPPLMPAPVQTEAPATAPAEPPPLAPEPEVAPPPPAAADVSPPPFETGLEAGAPPPLPAPARGFEERLGTRWVVWIGGLALALGGFFMVRYSIEAGLLGPGVRVFLGGLFALALLGAGEWTRRKEAISSIQALPIANIPAILTAAGTAVAFATIYAAYALYGFLVPATAFVLLGLVALGTLAAALLHGPALAGLGVVGAFVTPILVSSGKPDYWALYIYLAIVTAASFGLARIRLWRWLAVTTIVFAVLWIFPGLDAAELQVAPHAFHVIAGFVLAALLVVCGFMFGPGIEDGEIEPVSSSALGAYLFGAMLIVLSSSHADLALIAFTLLVAGTLFVAWRAPAATGALGAAAATVFIVFAEWAVRANPDMLVLPGGPHARHRTDSDRRRGDAASGHGRDLRRRLRHRRLPGTGPVEFGNHSGGLVGGRRRDADRDPGRALRAHRPSRPLDPVRDPGGAARRRVRRCDRGAHTPRDPAGRRDLHGPVRDRHAWRARVGAHLRAGEGLADDRAGADVARHGLDLDAAADSVPALACRDLRGARHRAHRLRSSHRRRRRRHHPDSELAAVGLRPAGAFVLGRERLPPWVGQNPPGMVT